MIFTSDTSFRNSGLDNRDPPARSWGAGPVVADVSRREIQSQRRADLDQHREEQRQALLNLDRRQTEEAGEHGRLIVGLAARALFLVAPRFALEVFDLLFDRG